MMTWHVAATSRFSAPRLSGLTKAPLSVCSSAPAVLPDRSELRAAERLLADYRCCPWIDS